MAEHNCHQTILIYVCDVTCQYFFFILDVFKLNFFFKICFQRIIYSDVVKEDEVKIIFDSRGVIVFQLNF